MQKYFIAIIPPEPILSEVKSFKMELYERFQTKAALKSPAHITLYMTFEWEEDKEAALEVVLQDFLLHFIPHTIELDGFDCFAPRVLFVKPLANPILTTIRKKLLDHVKTELSLFHKNFYEQPFHPHITIANQDLKPEDFEDAWQDFKEREYKRKFETRSFVLLKHNGVNWDIYREFEGFV